MLPFYRIVVNENDDTGIDYNSFVDVPAHMKGFIAFGKEQRYHFNDEKRIVTGVFISVGTPIYRHSEQEGEHYVVFDAETVSTIKRKFFKNGFNNNVNLNHDMNEVQKGAVLIDSYTIGGDKNPSAPEAFKHMNLQDGTWIGSYYITDDTLWEKVKSGKFQGFSVEGWFEKQKININKSKMSKNKKSVFDWIKDKFNDATEDAEPATFAQATTADGETVFYEGELSEGVAVFVELDGVQVPAPEGEHSLTLEDGSMKVITVDANGLVSTVEDVEIEEEMSIEEQVAEVMAKTIKDVNERFTKLEAENKALKTQLESIAKGGKFGADPKKTDSTDGKMTVAEILKLKK
jgi:hypothetical protein